MGEEFLSHELAREHAIAKEAQMTARERTIPIPYIFSEADDAYLQEHWPTRYRSRQPADKAAREDVFAWFGGRGIPQSAVYDRLSRLGWMGRKWSTTVSAPIETPASGDIVSLQSAVVALEDLLNEVADSVKRFRDSYQETIPGLRRDVQLLKERGTKVSDLEALIESRLSQAEDRLAAKIRSAVQSVQERSNPLAVIRQRLGEEVSDG